MPIQQGVDNALDRIFGKAVTEGLSSIGQPEQLNPRFKQGKRIRGGSQPETVAARPAPLNMSYPVQSQAMAAAPPPPPPPQQGASNIPGNILNFLMKGLEQGSTAAGAFLTQPWRTSPWSKEPKPEHTYQDLLSKDWWRYAFPYYPGGEEYQAYQDWKEKGDVPQMKVPIPSAKQLGAWIKPVIKSSPSMTAVLKEFGVDVATWEEPDTFDPATMRMAETAEFAPWVFIGGGKTAKTTLEKAADIAVKQIGKGKTTEEALSIAFNRLAAKGQLPKAGGLAKAEPKPAPTGEPTPPTTEAAGKTFADLVKESPALSEEAVLRLQQQDAILNGIKNKVAEALKTGKTQRKLIEAAKKQNRIPKMQEFAEELSGAKTPEDVGRAWGKMQGTILPEDAALPAMKDLLSQEEQAYLLQKILNAGAFQQKPFTAARTVQAFFRFFETGQVPTKAELRDIEKALGDILGKELLNIETPNRGRYIMSLLSGIINIPKGMMASIDMSAGRQLAPLIPRHPLTFIKTIPAGFKSILKEEWANAAEETMANSRFAFARRKLDLTMLPGKKGLRDITKVEEAFGGDIVHRIPIIGQITKRSERAFVTMLNKMRTDVFDMRAAQFEGKMGWREWDDLSELINVSSGRGAIRGTFLKSFVGLLNTAFFSPRLQISRVQALFLPATLWKYSPIVRRIAIENTVSFVAANVGLLTMIKIAADAGILPGVSVELSDPTSSDFGEIKVGDVRLDPLSGGQKQLIVFLSRLATGKMKTSTGQVIDIDRWDEMTKQVRLKLSPSIGFGVDVAQGKNVVGEKIDLATPEGIGNQVWNHFMGMYVQDTVDAARLEGLMGGIIAAPSFFGAGVKAYPSRNYMDWLDAIEKGSGKEWTQEEIHALRPDFNEAEASWLPYFELTGSRARGYWRKAHPKEEASMYFWGEMKSLSTPEAVQAFKDMAQEYGVSEDLFPIDKVQEPEDLTKKTEDEIFEMVLDVVPGVFGDYLNDNPTVIQATPETYAKYAEAQKQGQSLTRKYFNEIKLMGDNENEKIRYRVQNPDVDAALALWRGYTVKTAEARMILQMMLDELGIPHNLVKSLQPKTTTIKKATFSGKRIRG